ncbi:unnamed protein product [Rangifer tarandus platyrhynchus]|uniref:Uncharacterized protein n=1 Tax=Rangifer tarandus platyrhynchus TaxID=3082113 RepID=A0AC59YY31_RANTA
MLAPHKEEVLLHTLLASFCSIRGTSSLLLVLGKGYPISALDWSPRLQATVSGSRGTKPQAALPTGPWLASRMGRGPHLQLLAATRAPECPGQHPPPPVGSVQPRGESGEVGGQGEGRQCPF